MANSGRSTSSQPTIEDVSSVDKSAKISVATTVTVIEEVVESSPDVLHLMMNEQHPPSSLATVHTSGDEPDPPQQLQPIVDTQQHQQRDNISSTLTGNASFAVNLYPLVNESAQLMTQHTRNSISSPKPR